MAPEPITIFSSTVDPRGVAELLQADYPKVRIEGRLGDWTSITVTVGSGGWFRRAKTVTFTHSREYYAGPEWVQQRLGMLGYFDRFPEASTKERVMQVIAAFEFGLGVQAQDPIDLTDESDERREVVLEVCRHLDGCLFTPSALYDADGHGMLDALGTEFDDVRWPAASAGDSSDDDDDDLDDEDEDDDFDDEEDEDPEPHSRDRVVQRVIATAAVAARGMMENSDQEDRDATCADIREWVQALDAWGELEPWEAELLSCPPGAADSQATINATWRVEGLAVLAWALGLSELPPHDAIVDPGAVFDALGFLDAVRARSVLGAATRRSEDDLDGLEDQLFMIHWRVREYSLRPKAIDFASQVENSWFLTGTAAPDMLVDGDLRVGDVSIDAADEAEVARVNSIALERHLAINWLLGNAEVYSDTDCST